MKSRLVLQGVLFSLPTLCWLLIQNPFTKLFLEHGHSPKDALGLGFVLSAITIGFGFALAMGNYELK